MQITMLHCDIKSEGGSIVTSQKIEAWISGGRSQDFNLSHLRQQLTLDMSAIYTFFLVCCKY